MLMARKETGHGFGLSTLNASLPLLCILPGAYIMPMLLRRAMPYFGPRLCMIVSGIVCTGSFLGFAFVMRELWLAYFWVTVYGIGVCGCFTVGWALLASAARADNTAINIAAMTAAQKVAASIAIALVIITLNPAAGPAPTSVYRACFVGIALVCFAAYVVLSLFVVPRHLRDRHAADSA
jgi:Na+/melibiose symporter-like transporter